MKNKNKKSSSQSLDHLRKQGEERYDVVFPKYKKGGYIVRKVTVDPTYRKQ